MGLTETTDTRLWFFAERPARLLHATRPPPRGRPRRRSAASSKSSAWFASSGAAAVGGEYEVLGLAGCRRTRRGRTPASAELEEHEVLGVVERRGLGRGGDRREHEVLGLVEPAS